MQLSKRKDSAEPAHRMKHSCKTLPCDSSGKALSQYHPANTGVKGKLLTPALIHDHEGAQHAAACDQEGSQHILPECAPFQPKGKKPAVSLLAISNDEHWVQ